MARRRKGRGERPAVETSSYTDSEGNELVLRTSLSHGSIRKIGQTPQGAASADDAWKRRTEMLFERLTVRWEIAGLPLDDQAMLVGRYRMADPATRAWVHETIAKHIAEHIPELAG